MCHICPSQANLLQYNRLVNNELHEGSGNKRDGQVVVNVKGKCLYNGGHKSARDFQPPGDSWDRQGNYTAGNKEARRSLKGLIQVSVSAPESANYGPCGIAYHDKCNCQDGDRLIKDQNSQDGTRQNIGGAR